jgi:hypothetical protein
MRALLLIALVAACGKSTDKTASTGSAAASAGPAGAASKADTSLLNAKRLAFEAYPSWAVAHPDAACPKAIDELLEYVPRGTEQDAWGHPYDMFCGPTLPAGARGLAIRSRGADGQPDTADDLKSW